MKLVVLAFLFFGVLGCQSKENPSDSPNTENPSPLPIPEFKIQTRLDIDGLAYGDSVSPSESTLIPVIFSIISNRVIDKKVTVKLDVLTDLTFGSDISATSIPSEITFEIGEIQKDITFNLISDSIYEKNENLRIQLVSGDDHNIAINQSSVKITVVDDEVIPLSVDPTYTSITESVGSVSFELSLLDDEGEYFPAPYDLVYSLTLENSGTTATLSSDFEMLTEVTIPQGQSSVILSLNILNDAILENEERLIFRVKPKNDEFPSYPYLVNVIIKDDDGPFVTASGVSGSTSLNEASTGTVAKVRFTRTGWATTSALPINCSISGTAILGVDYTGSCNSLQIPAGQSSVDLTFTVINDSIFESSESIIVNLLDSAEYGRSLTTGSSATIYITDNDASSRKRSLLVSGSAQTDGYKLDWSTEENLSTYSVYRRKIDSETNFTKLSTLASGIISYVDTTAIAGVTYEYKIEKPGPAAGYVAGGINLPAIHDRGKILLLVESGVYDGIKDELDEYKQTLSGDGWAIIENTFAKTDLVPNVKNYIVSTANSHPSIKQIIIIGHIPVPYSGQIYPDGHTNHNGAWPSDLFYGDLNGTWTDTSVNDSSATRTQNRNIPNDGKYDQSYFPSAIEIPVSRIDFFDMPAFAPLTEVDLLKRYLSKNINFRKNVNTIPKRALIDNNFGDMNGEAFAASGWRTFGANVGASQIFTSFDLIPELNINPYLWVFGDGGGSYTTINGINAAGAQGATSDFVNNNNYGVFNMYFGSYFGDWDSTNNILRASIAANGYSLTSVWSGRPSVYFHLMGGNLTAGESLVTSINNSTSYITGYYPKMVHLGLMGDGSLRQDYSEPVTNFQANIVSNSIQLSWDTNAKYSGYHIYISQSQYGPYTLVNSNAVSASTFEINDESNIKFVMIRGKHTVTNNTCSFENLSTGEFVQIR